MSTSSQNPEAEVIAQRDAEIVAWLGKKAREYASVPKRRQESVPDVIGRLASKIARDAVRPDNMLGAATSMEDAAALELRAENARLTARVAELEDAAYGDATVRLLEPVEQIRHLHASVAAQMSRADTLNRIARQLRARIAELEDTPPRRRLTPSEYSAAWHAVEGGAGEEGADPATILNAVLARLDIDGPEHGTLPGWVATEAGESS